MAGGVALWNLGEEMKVFYSHDSVSVFDSDEATKEALRTFNKQDVVAAHAKLQHAVVSYEELSESQGTYRTCLPSYMDKFCQPALFSSTGLKRIGGLKDLDVGRCHPGFVLHGRLGVKAFRCSNVAVTALEDESGNMARLLAFNTLLWNSSPGDVERMYPQGAQVVVKEPCLLDVEFCQGTSLWVPNPVSLEIVSCFPDVKADDAEGLLQSGRREFGKKSYAAAADILTRCIELLQHGSVVDERKELLASALLSRAESWMKLHRYEKALEDAELALVLDPRLENGHVMKGLALFGLKQYSSSSSSFKRALEQLESSPGLLRDSYNASVVLEKQSKQAKYELGAYYLNGCDEETAPDVAEYVGAVKINMTSDGRGRGLFLTEDVNRGDILIVSNAVALVFPDESSKDSIMEMDKFGTLLTTVLKECIASPRTLAQVYACSGEGLNDVPDLGLFRPNTGTGVIITQDILNSPYDTGEGFKHDELKSLDVVRISNILHCVNESGQAADPLVSRDFDGFWTLPGFINHSCLPNVSVHRVGRALFVIAARDMKAGTEMLRSYGGALAPWSRMRRESLRFDCRCDRCELERRVEESLKDVSSRYDAVLNAESMSEEEFDESLGSVAVDLERLLVELQLGEEEKQWLRTSYCLAYLAYHGSDTKGKGLYTGSQVPPAEAIVEALHSTAPGFSKTLMTMACFSSYSKTSERRVRELLELECSSLCGRQKPDVVEAVLREALTKGKMFFW